MRVSATMGVLILGLVGYTAATSGQTDPRVANLGTCQLRGGEAIRECRVAYRTHGTLSPLRDNVVLIPTWFTGRSSDWAALLGRGAIVDTTHFFVVVADALGNGVSSSPSNSRLDPGTRFPAITIRDMVDAHHRLLKEHLRITHLSAVVGVSMGGMQAFEWGVGHPEFTDRIVAIMGSPRTAAYDRILWSAALSAIEFGREYGVPDDAVYLQLTRLFRLVGYTPRFVNETDPNEIDPRIEAASQNLAMSMSLEDLAAQLHAMIDHDVSRSFGGDLRSAASAYRGEVLVVYSPDDHSVTSGPAISFARLLGAETLSVPSPCGHEAFRCEMETVGATVQAFLAR